MQQHRCCCDLLWFAWAKQWSVNKFMGIQPALLGWVRRAGVSQGTQKGLCALAQMQAVCNHMEIHRISNCCRKSSISNKGKEQIVKETNFLPFISSGIVYSSSLNICGKWKKDNSSFIQVYIKYFSLPGGNTFWYLYSSYIWDSYIKGEISLNILEMKIHKKIFTLEIHWTKTKLKRTPNKYMK